MPIENKSGFSGGRNMAGYRLWCKNNNEWEKDNSWIGMNGCLMTLRNGCPFPLRSDTHILQRSTEKNDISGKEIFEGDIIESHVTGGRILALNMIVQYGTYRAWCPIDKEYMTNVGFYVSVPGLPDMPLGPTEDYAKVIGNIFENPELIGS